MSRLSWLPDEDATTHAEAKTLAELAGQMVSIILDDRKVNLDELQRHERVKWAVWTAQATHSLLEHLLSAVGTWVPPEAPSL